MGLGLRQSLRGSLGQAKVVGCVAGCDEGVEDVDGAADQVGIEGGGFRELETRGPGQTCGRFARSAPRSLACGPSLEGSHSAAQCSTVGGEELRKS